MSVGFFIVILSLYTYDEFGVTLNSILRKHKNSFNTSHIKFFIYSIHR
jgi:hypothetical protein